MGRKWGGRLLLPVANTTPSYRSPCFAPDNAAKRLPSGRFGPRQCVKEGHPPWWQQYVVSVSRQDPGPLNGSRFEQTTTRGSFKGAFLLDRRAPRTWSLAASSQSYCFDHLTSADPSSLWKAARKLRVEPQPLRGRHRWCGLAVICWATHCPTRLGMSSFGPYLSTHCGV